MPLALGSATPDAWYIGTHLVHRAYRGGTVVYDRNPPASVGARVGDADISLDNGNVSMLDVRTTGRGDLEFWYNSLNTDTGLNSIHTFNVRPAFGSITKFDESLAFTTGTTHDGGLSEFAAVGIAADATHVYLAQTDGFSSGRIERRNRPGYTNLRPVTVSHGAPHALSISRGRVLCIEASQRGTAEVRAYTKEMDPDPSIRVPVDIDTSWTFSPPAIGLMATNTHVLTSQFRGATPIATANWDVDSYDYAGREDGTSTLPDPTPGRSWGAMASAGDRCWIVDDDPIAGATLRAFEFNGGA